MNKPDIEKLRDLLKNNPSKLKLLESMYTSIENANFPSILEIKPNSNDSIHSIKKITKMLGYKLIGRKEENRFFIIRKSD